MYKMNRMTQIKIGIADDATLLRKGLSFLLNGQNGIDVVLEAVNGQDLLDKLEAVSNQLDILILDLEMPVLDGIKALEILREKYSDIKVIILSGHYNESFILNMVEVGAAAYLPKDATPSEFISTIRNVYENGFHYNEKVWKIIEENKDRDILETPQLAPTLTKRELEILQLICEQQTASEIAEKLYISRRTVEGHRTRILQKLNCRNVAGMVAYAIQNRLVKFNPQQFW